MITSLQSSASQLQRFSKTDKTGKVGEASLALKRTIRRLELHAPKNDELFVLLQLPRPPDDDVVGAAAD